MTVNILWTGGLDSTYRVAELTRLLPKGSSIQPYYIVDEQRRSTSYELKAIRAITSKIKDKNCDVNLQDIIVINKSDIKPNEEITAAYTNFGNKYKLGGQYDWLSRFAHENNIHLEVGLELLPDSRTLNTIEGNGSLVSDGDEPYSCLIIDNNVSSNDLKLVFGKFKFPKTMKGTSKKEEIRRLKEWGYADIVLDTWFCHRPVLGKPCGRCNPCRDCIDMGLEWRVPTIGRILGQIRRPIIFFEKVVSKLKS